MPQTWGEAAATVDLDIEETTVHPFAAVIAEYQKHGEKAVRRSTQAVNALVSNNRTKASLYYFEQAIRLGAL